MLLAGPGAELSCPAAASPFPGFAAVGLLWHCSCSLLTHLAACAFACCPLQGALKGPKGLYEKWSKKTRLKVASGGTEAGGAKLAAQMADRWVGGWVGGWVAGWMGAGGCCAG